MTSDSPHIRCLGKINLTRKQAIAEATRIGFPVSPYRCPNGHNHWHVGNSKKHGNLFHNHRARWERKPRNQEDSNGNS